MQEVGGLQDGDGRCKGDAKTGMCKEMMGFESERQRGGAEGSEVDQSSRVNHTARPGSDGWLCVATPTMGWTHHSVLAHIIHAQQLNMVGVHEAAHALPGSQHSTMRTSIDMPSRWSAPNTHHTAHTPNSRGPIKPQRHKHRTTSYNPPQLHVLHLAQEPN